VSSSPGNGCALRSGWQITLIAAAALLAAAAPTAAAYRVQAVRRPVTVSAA